MIIYRVQTYPGTEDWANEYHPTLAEGKAGLKASTEAEIPARLDKLLIPDDKAGLVEFLNVVSANHMNQPVLETIARNYE